ncbi:MAG: helix-turn-helix domain-containing protein [Synechococcales bacterium]|nr:helix-turn-helix domain-containing protein [Cyanobacteria bacterium REEB444]MEB3125331.1 helix-turn-helix domain-containing protein [Synechococcales bacterium]
MEPTLLQAATLSHWGELVRRHWNYTLRQRLEWLRRTRLEHSAGNSGKMRQAHSSS